MLKISKSSGASSLQKLLPEQKKETKNKQTNSTQQIII